MGIREDYLGAAAGAVDLLREPAVARAWGEPSALEGFTVGGLAAHLANQVLYAATIETASPGEPVSLLENYARAPWVGEGAEHEANVAIREAGEEAGKSGAEALVAEAEAGLGTVRRIVEAAPESRVVRTRAGWDLTFDDFLLTRLMEIAVHSDDLAVSARIATPPLAESAAFAVTDLLSRLSVRRHGLTPVLRALSRSERAPETVAAL